MLCVWQGKCYNLINIRIYKIYRIGATPVIGYLVVEQMYTPACILFVIAGFTDMVTSFLKNALISHCFRLMVKLLVVFRHKDLCLAQCWIQLLTNY